MEVQRTNKEIDEIIGNFEQRKLRDVKQILSDFILITMKQQTKALEVLSASYYDVCSIDERDDFLEFQKLMKTKEEPTGRKSSLKKGLRSQSMDSLDRDQLKSPLKRQQKLSRSSKNLTGGGIAHASKSEEETEGDEEDEEEAVRLNYIDFGQTSLLIICLGNRTKRRGRGREQRLGGRRAGRSRDAIHATWECVWCQAAWRKGGNAVYDINRNCDAPQTRQAEREPSV